MALNFQPARSRSEAQAAAQDDLEPTLLSRLATAGAVGLAVLLVATITVLIGMA